MCFVHMPLQSVRAVIQLNAVSVGRSVFSARGTQRKLVLIAQAQAHAMMIEIDKNTERERQRDIE